MNRRNVLSTLIAGSAASLTGFAQASTLDKFSGKTRPVDTMNRVDDWTVGKVQSVKIKLYR